MIHRSSRAALFLCASAALAACGQASDKVTAPVTTTPTLQSNPCTGGGSVQLTVNQATRIDCSNGGSTISLPGNGASYLLVPQFATENATDTPVSFLIGLGGTPSASIATLNQVPSLNRGAPALEWYSLAIGGADGLVAPAKNPGLLQHQFDEALRAAARARYATGGNMPAILRDMVAPAVPRSSAAATSATIGSLAAFQVRATFSSTNPQWKAVTARLAYAGANILLYIDTLAPAGGFSAAQLQSFGQYFDQTLYPIDVNAFGPPSDVDRNGAVIMLMSPAVNALSPSAQCATQGYVEGYFDEIDLGDLTSSNSNKGEIFYSIVPDSMGTVSCQHTVSELLQTEPATFLHELQHLISFSQHVVVHNANPQEGWLDEGMSIMAEELGSMYYEQKCPPPSCRTNPAQLFPDSSQGFIDGFLYDSYEYLLKPDTASVTLHDDSEDGFSWRGGDWLIVHWLYDHKGASVLTGLEQNPLAGVPSIEAAAGESFPSLFADMGLAMYTDSLPGLARSVVPVRDRYITRDLRLMYNRLYVTASPNGGASDIPRPFPILANGLGATSSLGSMVPGTSVYYRLDTPSNAANVLIQFANSSGAALSANLKPQVAIYRLQ